MSNEPTHAANFDENDYARPNQPWRCGWAAEGHACPLGPTRMGTCRSAHECAPYQDGDTWVCARIKANGGPCDEGPLPDGRCCRAIQKCQPVRGIMSRRGVVSLCVFAAAIGVALIMVAAPGRSRVISPGPLISAHRQAVDHCEDCHVAGDGKLSDWVKAAFDSQAAKHQSRLCLKCHAELGADALRPHGQSSFVLSILSNEHAERSGDGHAFQVAVAKNTIGNPADPHVELSCATCHREHHGATDLTALTNQQCQVCHTASFHSFSNGHPELENYPNDRRTRIYFDHQTHFGVHFSTVDREAHHECRDCHTPDSAGRYMLIKRFEETCAQCHVHQIEDDTMPGLVVAAIPAVDVESLRAAGAEIGRWPEIYPMHVEATSRLAPFHTLISPRGDDLWSAQNKLEGVDLADLHEATPEQLRNVETLIWTFKESLVDILATGRAGLQADFSTRLKNYFDEEQIEKFVGAVPLEGIATMQRQWLPNVVEEVEARRAGTALPELESEKVATSAPETAAVASADLHASRLLSGGWFLHSPSMSLRYRPTHHADPFMKTLFDLSVLPRGPVNLPADAPRREFYESLASPHASGRCQKCHTVDINWPGGGGTPINWLTHKPPLAQHAFTRFNHAPHLATRTNDGCLHCHEFAQIDNTETPILRSEVVNHLSVPATVNFKADFAHMSKSNCAECHTKQSARDSCTTCHNYHVR